MTKIEAYYSTWQRDGVPLPQPNDRHLIKGERLECQAASLGRGERMVKERETPEKLRAEVEHLRRLAGGVLDERVRAAIEQMIEELERRAREIEQQSDR